MTSDPSGLLVDTTTHAITWTFSSIFEERFLRWSPGFWPRANGDLLHRTGRTGVTVRDKKLAGRQSRVTD